MIKFLEKVEKNKFAISTVLMIAYCVFINTDFVTASDNGSALATDIATKVIEALIKVIFIGGGILMLIFGVVEVVLAIGGQNPDAKNKAIMGFAVGFALIVLGIAFLQMVSDIVSFMIQ